MALFLVRLWKTHTVHILSIQLIIFFMLFHCFYHKFFPFPIKIREHCLGKETEKQTTRICGCQQDLWIPWLIKCMQFCVWTALCDTAFVSVLLLIVLPLVVTKYGLSDVSWAPQKNRRNWLQDNYSVVWKNTSFENAAKIKILVAVSF